ncbi:MAG: cobyrinate a,c-diamide synthase [Desulfobacteraceae bacterium]|nr:cobyrinate a,c-diamide synthase [Desulfobacteraceae bacterium]
MKGFVIAATGSGTGKTTVSLAILSYLCARGIKAAPFKVGPDFIDPGHHGKITGKTSFNLDSWMLTKAYNKQLFAEKSKGMDLAVVEGVMGLFDGYDAVSETGSTAQMAKWLGLPVLLIVSAKGKARSAAAIVKGFETFDPDLTLAGVIFSQTGSQRHYECLKDAVEQNCKTPCLGFMPKNEKIVMPERHLGLMTADELAISSEVLSILVSMVEKHIDMDALMKKLPILELEKSPVKPLVEDKILPPVKGESPVIAVARDKAFCFYYQDNIEALKKAGAKIVNFSPLADDQLPRGIDGIYFGGGYPEVFAKNLSVRQDLLARIKALSLSGMPIYGECGGFMYLCSQVSSMDEKKPYNMAGCFDFSVQMSKKLRSLGYREITLTADTIIGKKGAVLRGHEFHYSSLKDEHLEKNSNSGDSIVKNVYSVTSRVGQDILLKGFQKNQTLGSYLHVHFGSNPDCAQTFVENCANFRDTLKVAIPGELGISDKDYHGIQRA